jgi:hypothetical protein
MTPEEYAALVPGDVISIPQEGFYIVISNDTAGQELEVASCNGT